MNYFLDTEFYERGPEHPIELISIGLVCEDGSIYYAENNGVDLDNLSPWLKENVVPSLKGPKKSCSTIMKDVLEFMPPAAKPKVWGYYADYDWVVFCQLFGAMIGLPRGYPMFCRDLMQLAEDLEVDKKHWPKQVGTEHHAGHDARWNSELYNFLMQEGEKRLA